MIKVGSRHKKLLQILSIGIVLVLLALYIGFPTVMALAAVIPENGTSA